MDEFFKASMRLRLKWILVGEGSPRPPASGAARRRSGGTPPPGWPRGILRCKIRA